MNVDLNRLCAVLEAELAVGQRLAANLAAIKAAIVDWDIERLLCEIDARQPAVDELFKLEMERHDLLRKADEKAFDGGLRSLIGSMTDTPERRRLSELRGKAQQVFTGLHGDERRLMGLMENLLTHIHEALTPLVPATAPVYGERGAARPLPVGAALIRSKI